MRNTKLKFDPDTLPEFTETPGMQYEMETYRARVRKTAAWLRKRNCPLVKPINVDAGIAARLNRKKRQED